MCWCILFGSGPRARKAAGADDTLPKGLSGAALGRELARIVGATAPGMTIDYSSLAQHPKATRRHLVGIFARTAPESVAGARAALAAGNSDHAFYYVHRLKGAAAYAGAIHVVSECQAMPGLPPAKHHSALESIASKLTAALATLQEFVEAEDAPEGFPPADGPDATGSGLSGSQERGSTVASANSAPFDGARSLRRRPKQWEQP